MSGLSLSDPISFSKVISSPNVIPGDVILLRGGTYRGYWHLDIGGSEDNPIIIKPYNNEPVIIDGGLKFNRPYIKICDIEFLDSNLDITNITESIDMSQIGCWLIGCHIHNLHNSGVQWFSSGVGGIVECWIHDNGYHDNSDGLGHGHAIYTHNNLGGTRLIARNLLGEQRGKYSLHVYSVANNYLRDYVIEDNVINGDPAICGGGLGLRNYTCQRNIEYHDYWFQGRYSLQPNDGGLIKDNLFIGLYDYSVQSNFQNLIEENNIVWGGQPSNRAGYVVNPMPIHWTKFIPFSLSEKYLGIKVSIDNGIFNAVMILK